MSDPRPEEFRRFHDLLVEHAPDGYTPWYFRVREGSKAPATKYGSWKDDDARLSVDEAAAWMEDGGNVGVAGTAADELVNVDIDDEDETTADDLKQTLIARSRSRTGVHAWYFAAPGEEIPNIPTDDAGEVRANWQYVVAPGSYVETDPATNATKPGTTPSSGRTPFSRSASRNSRPSSSSTKRRRSSKTPSRNFNSKTTATTTATGARSSTSRPKTWSARKAAQRTKATGSGRSSTAATPTRIRTSRTAV